MMCCFQQPIVSPSQRAKNVTSILKILVLVELLLGVMKIIFYAPFSGIYELIDAWILCMAYSQMNFCTLVIYMFICMSNFVYAFAYVGWIIQFSLWDLLNATRTTGFVVMIFAMIFYVVAIYYCFQAYREYKALLFEQSAGAASMMSYGLMPSTSASAQHQEEEQRRPPPQAQPQNPRYEPPPQEERRPPNPPQNFSAFSGQGVRLGGN